VAVFPLPGVSVTGCPTGEPWPAAHPAAPLNGPHTEKLTVPDGAPPAPFPVTVAESVFCPPSAIELFCGVEAVVEDPGVTVKHSPGLLSLEGS
jgi:hypothetical protein